ncbi:hypothetical protein HYALB_00003523 [Hymenoscyphus albidus]|uniref:Methyltransferase type 11 domain-containing protein n=1 Tax=Hymenoscyphus albidus TaxID=595503 RepID=A0A9N9M1F8_9HELO|nr:hypothetical protein HYALB_00003523 [Hymenoscyphus albidus]
MAPQTQSQHPNLPQSDFFSKFASVYIRQTGRSTLDILADVIKNHVQTSASPFGQESIVHDTAAGPGIGAAAIIATLPKDQLPKKMLVTDNNAMMASAAAESLDASPLPDINCKQLDSQDLSSVPDNYFSHSIDNFSIFTFVSPVDAVRETHRTLSSGGLAVVTCWRRFAPMFMIHAAQKKLRPDLPLMPAPGPEFFEEGVLQRVVEEGGFPRNNITMIDKVLLVTEEDNIAGLTMLMSGPMMSKARDGYTEEEQTI